MKRVFTLLMALGILTAADAQRGNRARVGVSVSVGNNGFYPGSFAADRMLRQEIARINFKYDRQVQQVRNSFFMRPVIKAKKIRRLEQQRHREISRAYANARFNGNRYGQNRRHY